MKELPEAAIQDIRRADTLRKTAWLSYLFTAAWFAFAIWWAWPDIAAWIGGCK